MIPFKPILFCFLLAVTALCLAPCDALALPIHAPTSSAPTLSRFAATAPVAFAPISQWEADVARAFRDEMAHADATTLTNDYASLAEDVGSGGVCLSKDCKNVLTYGVPVSLAVTFPHGSTAALLQGTGLAATFNLLLNSSGYYRLVIQVQQLVGPYEYLHGSTVTSSQLGEGTALAVSGFITKGFSLGIAIEEACSTKPVPHQQQCATGFAGTGAAAVVAAAF